MTNSLVVRHLALAWLVLAGCSKSDLARPGVDAGGGGIAEDPTEQWVYVNDCRALSDYFLVTQGPQGCVIAAFADRFPPTEGTPATEIADVTRGPAPCPDPGAALPGYPEARASLEVVVRVEEGTFHTRLAGRFPDGVDLDLEFASADRRSCCACWGRDWPVPAP